MALKFPFLHSKLLIVIRDLFSTFRNLPVFYCCLICIQGLVESLAIASVMPLLSIVGMDKTNDFSQQDIISRIFEFASLPLDTVSISIFLWSSLIISAILFLIQANLGAYMQSSYISIWRVRISNAIMRSDYGTIRAQNTGRLLSALIGEADRCGGVVYQLNLITTATLHSATTLIVACLISMQVTVTLILLGAILFLLSRRFLHLAYSYGQKLAAQNAALSGATSDMLNGIKYLKATGTEAAGVQKFNEVRKNIEHVTFKMMGDVQKAKAIFDFGGAIIFAFLLVVMPLYGGIEITAIITILALFVRLLPRLVGLQQGLQMMHLTLPTIETMKIIYSELTPQNTAPSQTSAPIPAMLAQNAIPIHIDGLCVENDGKPILTTISGSVAKGNWLTIIGASGAGKTTLLDAICGLLRPNSGSITFSGKNWQELEHTKFRERIGFVEQDTTIFDGTILENLCLGLTDVPNQAVYNSMQEAGLGNLIANLSDIIGENGRPLSGGERQRLAIARALIRNPGLLILDEATSALDPKTEQDILDTLVCLKGKTTIIMTTHRPAATFCADEIWVMENGKIIERGSAEHLQFEENAYSNWLNNSKIERR